MTRYARALNITATILWMAFIFYLSSIPDLKSSLPTVWDTILRKCAHALEYAILFVLIARSLRGVRRFLAIAFIITIAYALTDEYHQNFVAGRFGSAWDIAIDSAGALSALLITKNRPPFA